jgi:hypothetical protein
MFAGVVCRVAVALVAAAGVGIPSAAVAARPNPAVPLVLSERDVGGNYTLNRRFSVPHTLAGVSTAAPAPVKQQLARLWVAGVQTGFNGNALTGGRSILSFADLFRTTALTSIVQTWEQRFLLLSHGSSAPVPRGAPGTNGFLLIHGRLASDEMILYMWRHGKAILSTWLIGRPAVLRLSLLVKLAAIQDAHATAALG